MRLRLVLFSYLLAERERDVVNRSLGNALTLGVSLALALAGCGDAPRDRGLAKGDAAAVASDAVAAVETSSASDVPQDFAQAPEPAGVESELGGEPAAVPESTSPPDRTSPPAVVRSLESALEARDLAALARLRIGGSKRVLDEDDLARAERDFFANGRDHYWRRVLRGVNPTQLARLEAEGARARLAVPVGGALGSVELEMERGDDGWVLLP